MSFTGLYSPIEPLEADRPRGGAIITDMEAFEAMGNDVVWGSIINDADMITVTVGEYPKEEYKALKGFRTWESKSENVSTLGFYHNIGRIAMQYDPETFEVFWQNIAECCEPFEFYHPWSRNGLSESGSDVVSENQVVYHVVSDGEKIDINEVTIGVINQ